MLWIVARRGFCRINVDDASCDVDDDYERADEKGTTDADEQQGDIVVVVLTHSRLFLEYDKVQEPLNWILHHLFH